jgi:uncharacterized protein
MGLALAVVAASLAFPQGKVVLTTPARSVVVRVEVARTPAQQERGLMYRRRLAPRAGMVFVWPQEIRSGFWMKNTRIPLSIAFAGQDGTIRRILDMTPCRHDPCRVYDPGVAFASALEVNRGAFRRWGVHRGHRLTLRPLRRS